MRRGGLYWAVGRRCESASGEGEQTLDFRMSNSIYVGWALLYIHSGSVLNEPTHFSACQELSGGTGYDFDPDLLAADPEEDEVIINALSSGEVTLSNSSALSHPRWFGSMQYDGPSDPNLASIEYLANHDLSEWPGWLNKAAGVRQRATQLQSEHLDRQVPVDRSCLRNHPQRFLFGCADTTRFGHQAELTTAPAAPPPSKRSPRTGRRTERPQQPRHSQAKPAAAAGPNKGTGTPSLRMRSRLADGGNPPNGGKFARVQQLKHANGPKRNPGNMSSPGITTCDTIPSPGLQLLP